MRPRGVALGVLQTVLALVVPTRAAAAPSVTALHAAAAAHVEVAPASPLTHSPAAFTVSGVAADCSAIVVEFGDGARQQARKESPGRWTASHAYAQPGTYAVKAAAPSPCSMQAGKATVVVKLAPVRAGLAGPAAGGAAPGHAPQTAAAVGAAAGSAETTAGPLFPFPRGGPPPPAAAPGVTVTPSSPSVNSQVSFKAVGLPAGCAVTFIFGDGQSEHLPGSSSVPTVVSAVHAYAKGGTYAFIAAPDCAGVLSGQATVTVK